MQTVAERREMPMELHDEKFKRIDERFDDVAREFKRVDRRFEEVNCRITEGREESKQRFDRVESDIRELREGDIRELKQVLAGVQTSLNRFVISAAGSWVILMVTILAKG